LKRREKKRTPKDKKVHRVINQPIETPYYKTKRHIVGQTVGHAGRVEDELKPKNGR
jgi:hypothetical protein